MEPIRNGGHASASASIDALSAQMSALVTHDETSFCKSIFSDRYKAEVRGLKGFRMELHLLRLVYSVALDALDKLQESKYECFDALVSECACHLRALKICHIAEEREKLFPYAARIKNALLSIDGLLPKNIHFAKCRFETMLQNYPLDIQVSEDLIFLTEARLLTLTREVVPIDRPCIECGKWVETTEEKTASEQLIGLDYALTKGYRHTLVMRTKERLAARSIAFIQEEARTKLASSISRMLGAENVREIEQRKEIPCAYSLTHVVSLAAQSDFPILLKVQRCQHLFEDVKPFYDTELYLKPIEGRYTPCRAFTEREKPLIVIEGRRLEKNGASADAYRDRLVATIAKVSFERLIEMFSAYHDQYTGQFSRLEDIPMVAQDERELARLKALSQEAEEMGLTRSTQTLILITHMFVGTMRDHSIREGVKDE